MKFWEYGHFAQKEFNEFTVTNLFYTIKDAPPNYWTQLQSSAPPDEYICALL